MFRSISLAMLATRLAAAVRLCSKSRSPMVQSTPPQMAEKPSVTPRPSARSRFVGADFGFGIPQLMRSLEIPQRPRAFLLSYRCRLEEAAAVCGQCAIDYYPLGNHRGRMNQTSGARVK